MFDFGGKIRFVNEKYSSLRALKFSSERDDFESKLSRAIFSHLCFLAFTNLVLLLIASVLNMPMRLVSFISTKKKVHILFALCLCRF